MMRRSVRGLGLKRIKAMRAIARFFGWLTYVAAFLLLLGAIGWLTVPRALGWRPQVVLSGSMAPAMPAGSVAFVEPRVANEISVGDVLVYRQPQHPDRLVSHRVIAVQREGGAVREIRTKGDANDAQDPWVVHPEDVVGIVRFHIPYTGYVHQFVRTPAGFALLMGLPAMIVVVGEVANIARQIRGMRRTAS